MNTAPPAPMPSPGHEEAVAAWDALLEAADKLSFNDLAARLRCVPPPGRFGLPTAPPPARPGPAAE